VHSPALVPGAAVAMAAAAAVLAGCSASGPPAAGTAAAHVATVSLAGRRSAELDVLSGATSITVRSANLGSNLIRVATAAHAGIEPRLRLGSLRPAQPGLGRPVRLYLGATGFRGPAAVQVTLNSQVAWQLVFGGGSSRTAVYLGGGQLRGADFSAGVSRITMRLPRPRGTVTVVLAGGASQVMLTAPAGIPARLTLGGGAGHATLAGRSYTGIAGGTVFTAPGWGSAADRYNVEVPAGVSAISFGPG
jgi:hypothetical protein